MCGIFGVRGTPRAAALTHLGLYSLQHRGQESAGIAAVDDAGVAHGVKRMGLVSDGLHDGDSVILNPGDAIAEGVRVIPVMVALPKTGAAQ